MYQITIKYKDETEKVINEKQYDKACELADLEWNDAVKSIHLREIK